MTCSTCGRENPPHLTFCQECGQRLGPRIAPPTPPIGLGGQDPYGPPPALSPNPPRVATSLGMPQKPETGRAVDPSMSPAPPAAGGDRRCKVCDTINAPNLRYCTSCGSTLASPGGSLDAQPALAAPPSPLAVSAGPMPAPAVPAPIVPATVVKVNGANANAVEGTRTCNRCNGTAEASAQFCKFCGNPLGENPPTPNAFAQAPGLANHEARTPEGRAAVGPERPNGADASYGNVRAATAPTPQVAPMRPAPAPSASPIGPAAPAPVDPAPVYAPPPQPSALPANRVSAVPREAPPIQAAPPPQFSPQPPAAARAPSAPPIARAPSASPSPTRGRLVVIAKSGADGPSYPFSDLLDIGRLEGNVVVSEDPYLSPRHARVAWESGRLILRDLASTNGVFLRLAPSRDATPHRSSDSPEVAVPLADNDLILVGQQVLRFEILREAEAGFGPAEEHGTLLFGSPAAPRYARLCQRTVEGITRDVYYVRKVETVLGRESGDVVFTEDPFLSRRHAAIRLLSRDAGAAAPPRPTDMRFVLVDLGSSNGTFLRIRGDVELDAGDHFRVGQQLFRVDLDGVRG